MFEPGLERVHVEGSAASSPARLPGDSLDAQTPVLENIRGEEVRRELQNDDVPRLRERGAREVQAVAHAVRHEESVGAHLVPETPREKLGERPKRRRRALARDVRQRERARRARRELRARGRHRPRQRIVRKRARVRMADREVHDAFALIRRDAQSTTPRRRRWTHRLPSPIRGRARALDLARRVERDTRGEHGNATRPRRRAARATSGTHEATGSLSRAPAVSTERSLINYLVIIYCTSRMGISHKENFFERLAFRVGGGSRVSHCTPPLSFASGSAPCVTPHARTARSGSVSLPDRTMASVAPVGVHAAFRRRREPRGFGPRARRWCIIARSPRRLDALPFAVLASRAAASRTSSWWTTTGA